MGLRIAATACLVLLVLLACVGHTSSHGLVVKPISRNYMAFLYDPMNIRSWNPSECNGGGPKAVSDNHKLVWPEGKFDLCGEPANKNPKRWNYPRTPAETYVAGQALPVHQAITANHEGRMIMRLCPLNATSANYKELCQILPRFGCKGDHCIHWTLPPGQGLDKKKRPLIPAYQHRSFSWYVFQSSDDFNDVPTYVVNYKLPDGFTCEHCILHWYWLTGNTCNPSCDRSDPLYPNCDRKRMGYCGESSKPDKYPEEFWSCSDIKIVAK
ncbi:hypothetical protein OEZ86_005980 [Tetradesmus obliquus]|nr:hypothetical protein OEZ86_005980 [Tetradesmus obliquus]